MKTRQGIGYGRWLALAGVLTSLTVAANATGFRQVNLVSDQSGVARYMDTNLVNPWGLVAAPGGRLIAADNHSSMVTFYNRMGVALPVPIAVPAPGGGGGAPTGVVLNRTGGRFTIGTSPHRGSSVLLIVTEDGTIAGWSPAVDRQNAIIAVDNSASGAIYKGVDAVATRNGARLFAANFGQGKVEEYDGSFKLLKSFTDGDLETAKFVPFGIRVIGRELFVTYAYKANPTDGDETAGPGLGYVDVFDLDGNMTRRFATQGTLNAPWGLALAPGRFGGFNHALLVGNFGDGAINAYNLRTGAFLGQLPDAQGAVIHIDGLWGLNSSGGEGKGMLYFTAGPNDENHGLLGVVLPVPGSSGSGSGYGGYGH